jgi:predicted extracellular nuclease
MKRILFLAFIAISSTQIKAQDTALRVMFYNVENLFDTIDTPDKDDAEFLPNSPIQNNTANYNLKLDHLAKVVNAAFGVKSSPDLLGVCEVENRAVVEDLASRLDKQKSLQVIHEESLDGRGIDNALIYDTKKLKLVEHGVAEVELIGDRPTRYILWANFKMKGNDRSITVFVNHWPSRGGGEEESEPKRLKAEGVLKGTIYQLRLKYPDSDEIVMGDFNDYPTNKSMKDLENCILPVPESPCLVNMHEYLQGTGVGSHAYKGEWGMLDQILVSKGLYSEKNEFYIPNNSGQIVSFDWMMYESNFDQKMYPSRFYGKDKVFGGYSDHLPVSLVILKK